MLYFVLAAVVLLILAFALLRQTTVFEYEHGLRYTSGRFQGVIGPGSYWFAPHRTRIVRVDVRPRLVTVPGQEVISSDGVGLKLTLAAQYQVVDAAKAVHSIAAYQEAAYMHLQLALRQAVGSRTADELVSHRNDLGTELHAAAAPKLAELGLELNAAEIKDVMFPGDLKRVFTQVVRARQEGLAALEKARGEAAALRSLANAASLVEDRPAIMTLRLLQVLERDGGNSVVLNLAGGEMLTIPAKPARKDRSGPSDSEAM
jgi:regulator of protease activity HflC (stomatin/prohibitin superfamily)